MRRLAAMFSCLAAILLCGACGFFVDKDKVAEKVATLLRQKLEQDPAYKGLDLKEVLLARESLNRFSGYAVYRFERETEDVKLEVTLDGEKIDFRVDRPTGLLAKKSQIAGAPVAQHAEAPKPPPEAASAGKADSPPEAAPENKADAPPEPAKAAAPAPVQPQQGASDPDLQAALAFAKRFVEPRLVVCQGRTLTQHRDAGLPGATYYQLQEPEVFVHPTKAINEIDRQNGLQWQGRVSITGKYRAHRGSWSAWQSTGELFAADIRKLKGEWEITGNSLLSALQRPESCAGLPPPND